MQVECKCGNPVCSKTATINLETVFCQHCGSKYADFNVDIKAIIQRHEERLSKIDKIWRKWVMNPPVYASVFLSVLGCVLFFIFNLSFESVELFYWAFVVMLIGHVVISPFVVSSYVRKKYPYNIKPD